MKKGSLPFILLLTAVFCLLGLLSVYLSDSKISVAENERKQIPVFENIIDSSRDMLPYFNESLKGKTIVISAWASWQWGCKFETPALNALMHDFKSDNVVFLALDPGDERNERLSMDTQKIQFDYPIVYRQTPLIQLLASYELPGETTTSVPPLNMVINPDGKIEVYGAGFKPAKLAAIRDYLVSESKK
jgi:peroxiredoxin